ncbi:unnamed protein product, partial [Symbiodinium microadriaticum]
EVQPAEAGDVSLLKLRTLDVLLIDLADSASIALELLEEGIGDCVPFSEEANMLFPLATSLASYAMNWMGGLEGDRGAGYVTAEELIAAEEAPPMLGRKAKAEPPKRKPTVAALAAQQTDMLAAIQALSSRVQLLTKANQKLADMLGAPPRAALPKSPHAAAGALEDGPVALAIDGEGTEEGAPLAAALLAQSRALNTLVTQLAGSNDPLSDLGAGSSSSLSVKGSAARLKLQKELHSRTGAFFGRVQEAALRRMEPTANLSVLQGRCPEALSHDKVPRKAFDLLGSNQTEGAKDVLALAIVMIDQLVSDSGRADLGWILTLQEDPPSTVFSSPQHSSGSVRVCSHLADPKWVAVALSYVKEMGTLASRRAEVPRSQPSGLLCWEKRRSPFPRTSFGIRERSHQAPDTAVYPLPVPDLSVFLAGSPHSGSPGKALSAGMKEALIAKVLHVVVMSLNYLHSDLRHVPVSPEALRPYRDVEPSRLKISGDGAWPLADFLGPELKLAYLEPRVLRSIPSNNLPFPDTSKEDPVKAKQLLKLWDSRGLLFLAFEPKRDRELTRVFSAYKNEESDRQIGDRRGGNSLEGRLVGPSKTLPPGYMLTAITIPPGYCAIGASTDRADFYHQALISPSRAECN